MKLFSKKPDQRIQNLRVTVTQCDADRKRLLCWSQEPAVSNIEIRDMLAEFERDVSNRELGEKIVERWVKIESESAARAKLHSIAAPIVVEETERLKKAALKPALQAVIDGLQTQMDEIAAHDQQRATELELPEGDCRSPIRARLQDEINLTRQRIAEVDTMNTHRLSGVIREVLAK